MEFGQIWVPVAGLLETVISETTGLNCGSGMNTKQIGFSLLLVFLGKLFGPENDILATATGEDGRSNPEGQIMTQTESMPS
jgi:hypothetical protein